MAHAFIHYLGGARPRARPAGIYRTRQRLSRAPLADDPLDAMRGILFGVAISALGFWLPLALFLAH